MNIQTSFSRNTTLSAVNAGGHPITLVTEKVAEQVERTPGEYSVPRDPYDDWRGCEMPTFVPNRRQAIVMEATAIALDAGLFYNTDVTAHVAGTLHVSAEVLANNTVRVEGGNFGYDVYYARRAVEAQRKHAVELKLAGELRLVVGDKLGTLVFNDFKRNTGAIVESVTADGLAMTIVAKRGRSGVIIKPSPLQLKGAIERAHERGYRKDNFEEFIASRNAPINSNRVSSANILPPSRAPISPAQLAQLQADARDLRAAAARKGVTLDRWDEAREGAAARNHFDLGTWLFYYSTRVGRADGLQDRIDCLRRLFEAGIYQPGYQFFTVFDFGERTFDTCVEMGDADEVREGLREVAHKTGDANLIGAFSYMGWSLERKQAALF